MTVKQHLSTKGRQKRAILTGNSSLLAKGRQKSRNLTGKLDFWGKGRPKEVLPSLEVASSSNESQNQN
ncbi:MAG: hypothetical protein RR420_08620 [Anaerovoracaceae bacterium]